MNENKLTNLLLAGILVALTALAVAQSTRVEAHSGTPGRYKAVPLNQTESAAGALYLILDTASGEQQLWKTGSFKDRNDQHLFFIAQRLHVWTDSGGVVTTKELEVIEQR